MSLENIKSELDKLENKSKIPIYQNFFKTGVGEYAEGDIFLGITVPKQRELAQKYINLNLTDVKKLLENKIHEYRLTGFLILVYKFQKANILEKEKIVEFYLNNVQYANNWDLIDCVADKILGKHLMNKDKKILYEFAKSNNLWKKRIAIISTFEFIKNNKFQDTIKISKILLNDEHDLIHKAVGWMLREIGKRDIKVLESFLKENYKIMPRTMLRYSIEKFPEKKRKMYLKGKV